MLLTFFLTCAKNLFIKKHPFLFKKEVKRLEATRDQLFQHFIIFNIHLSSSQGSLKAPLRLNKLFIHCFLNNHLFI